MADADVGRALTGQYFGHVDPELEPDVFKEWGEQWGEILPLNGMKPEDFMRTRPPGEEGATMKNFGDHDVIFLRRKPSEPPLTS